MVAFFTKENITLLISILGACAWMPFLYERLQSPKIDCKVLGYDWMENGKFSYAKPFENGLTREINGNIFVIALRIISRNTDYTLKDVQVKVKFSSMQNEMDAYVTFVANINMLDKLQTYVSDINRNILYCPILKKDYVYDLETHFVVESTKNDVEYVKLIFINAHGKKQVNIIQKDDFKYAMRLFGR